MDHQLRDAGTSDSPFDVPKSDVFTSADAVCREPQPAAAPPPVLVSKETDSRLYMPGSHLPYGPAPAEDGMAKMQEEHPYVSKALETAGRSVGITVGSALSEKGDRDAVATRGARDVAAIKHDADRQQVQQNAQQLANDAQDRRRPVDDKKDKKSPGPLDLLFDHIAEENQRKR